ncbi:MAG: hypothetical protein RLP15_03355 [Cryomorphaceae bacterium]
MKWFLSALVAVVAFLQFFSVHAQDSLIQWSPSISVPKSEDILEFTLVDGSTPALITQFGESLIMRRFSDIEDERPLFIRNKGESKLIAKNISGDAVTLVEGLGPTSQGAFRLTRIRLHSTHLEPFYSVDFNLSRNGKASLLKPLMLAVSEHGDKVAICQQQHFQRSSKSEFNVLISDSKQAKLFHLPSDYDSDDVDLLGATIDSAGIVYLGVVAGVKLNSPFRKRFLIYSFNPRDSVLTEFDLSSQDLFIQDVVIRASDMGLFVAALYNSDPLEDRKSTGYIFIKLTADGKEIEQRIISTFDLSMVSNYLGAEQVKEAAVDNIYIQDVLLLGENPVLAIEKHYQDQICTADPRTGMLNCTDQFHFDGITLIDIMGRRTFLSIGRHQIDYDKRSSYSSHVSAPVGKGAQLFLYNDHFKNANIQSDKVMNNPNRSVVRYVLIQSDGSYTSSTLNDGRQSDFVFTPKYGLPLFNDSLYILTLDNRNLRTGKVVLDKLSPEL